MANAALAAEEAPPGTRLITAWRISHRFTESLTRLAQAAARRQGAQVTGASDVSATDSTAENTRR